MPIANPFTRFPFSRRRFLGATAGLAATALLPSKSYASDQLNVLAWCDHTDRRLLEPFAEAHNVRVNVRAYEGTGTALSILEQSRPGEWDVLMVDAPDVPQIARRGILDELPEDIAPWGDIFSELRDAPYSFVDGKRYSVPEKFGYYGYCYNTDRVDAEDARRGDIPWNETYSGRIAVYDYYFPIIQMIGLHLGLTPEQVTSERLPEVRDRLLAMKPNVSIIGDIVSVQNALVTGNVDVIAGGAEFTVSNLIPDNPHLDWTITDDGGLIWTQGIGVLADSARKDLASEFIRWIISPEGQGLLATSDCYWAMPANRNAVLDDQARQVLRWDQQGDFLARSHISVFPEPDLDAEMLDLWLEFMQS